MAKLRLSGLTNYHLKAIMNWSVGSGTGDAVWRGERGVGLSFAFARSGLDIVASFIILK